MQYDRDSANTENHMRAFLHRHAKELARFVRVSAPMSRNK